jgi:hypothetical protein
MDASTDSLLSGLSLDGERCSKSVLEKKAALAEPKRFVEDELLPKAKAWEV